MARVLIADDEPDVRAVLCGLLARMGHDVVPATDGLDAERRFGAEGPFDLVLSDVCMPALNGFDLLRRLQPRLGDRVPFVILSSHDDEDGVDAAIGAGAFDYLFKPYEETRVREVVERALAGAVPTARPPRSRPLPTGAPPATAARPAAAAARPGSPAPRTVVAAPAERGPGADEAPPPAGDRERSGLLGSALRFLSRRRA